MSVGLFTPVLKVIQCLHDLNIEHKGTWSTLSTGLSFLKHEMLMIQADIENYEEQNLQELAYEIEDFLSSLATPGAFGFVLTVLGMNPRRNEVERINGFKEKIERLEKRTKSPREEAKAGGSTPEAYSGSSRTSHDIELVGNAKPEFEEFLDYAVDAARLSVISIVGCRGLGKTALARAVYNDPGGFDCKAWVVASEYKGDPQGLLNKILQQIPRASGRFLSSIFVRESGSSSIVGPPEDIISTALQNKRYLVVIDDMLEEDMWDKVQSAFPDTACSRILVTTSIQSIATYIGGRKRSHHRYTMPYLDLVSSRILLHKKMGNPPGRIKHEDIILRKCDGLPLTLISVANHLRRDLTDHQCNDVAQSLGSLITADKPAFGDLKRTLADCYSSLPGYQERRCLLSVSMFPQGHHINMNSLHRKWIAEGLVAKQGLRDAMNIAHNSSSEFLNRSIIDPVLTGSSSDVKRCQVKGTMLEFIVHKSTCATNFATLVHPHGRRLPTDRGVKPIRRLFVWDGCMEEENNASIRWLTLCPNARFDLSKCGLVRVLDLEGCKWIDKKALENICKLVFLKYLSLRGTDVSEIPEQIKRLVNLETLDIRETRVKVLPIKVAMMPGLVHLFGQFQLVPCWPPSVRQMLRRLRGPKVFKKAKPPSKLETLSGVIIDNEEACFNQIMLHAKNLKKIKIWCNKLTATTGKFCGEKVLDSLSVDCSEPIRLLSGEFLESLSCAFLSESLNLRGTLEGLPVTKEDFMRLHKVEELQLSSTGRRWEELSVLQGMYGLFYLKLAENHHDSGNGTFVVKKDGFWFLRRLCIQAPRLPKVKFMEGAMPCLTSLELLQTAEETPGTAEIDPDLGVQGLSHLVLLNEVILHHSATDATVRGWKAEAKNNINTPHVKKQPGGAEPNINAE